MHLDATSGQVKYRAICALKKHGQNIKILSYQVYPCMKVGEITEQSKMILLISSID